jgi:hypothetical protein
MRRANYATTEAEKATYTAKATEYFDRTAKLEGDTRQGAGSGGFLPTCAPGMKLRRSYRTRKPPAAPR